MYPGTFPNAPHKNNIHYIGNAFHNYHDVSDDERGAMFLTWDEEPRM